MEKMYRLFQSICSDLTDMEEKSKVNLRIVPKLKSLAKECLEVQNFWVQTDVEIDTAFPAFHAARNSRIVVEKIIDRFQSHRKDENPRIISETEQIIPLLLEVCSKLKSVRESLPRSDFNVARQLFAGTRKLRLAAARLDMLPSLTDELKDVNRKVLTEEFENLRKHWMLEILEM